MQTWCSTSPTISDVPINGRFDRAKFEQLLRSAGYSEQRFLNEQRGIMLRRQMRDSLTRDLPVPKAWLEAINEFQNQERSIEYVTLGPAQAGDIPTDLGRTQQIFRGAQDPVSSAGIPQDRDRAGNTRGNRQIDGNFRRGYEGLLRRTRSRYVTPERRHVEQIVFPNAQEAEAAEAKLKGGLSFAALAAEPGLKDQDIDLGMLPKAEIIDPAVADAAFSLKEGEISQPVKGRFGTVIVTVLKIEPEVEKTLAEVTPQIRTDITAERAKAEVQSLHDKIEDTRAGGSTLEEAAQKAKLPVMTYDVDRSGHDPSGNSVANLPHAAEVINAAFASMSASKTIRSRPTAATSGSMSLASRRPAIGRLMRSRARSNSVCARTRSLRD